MDACKALVAESYEARRKLLSDLQSVGWPLPETVDIGEAPGFSYTTEDVKKRHGRLAGELRHFNNMVTAYGPPMIYPVYRNLSALPHTTDLTAAAYVELDDEGRLTVHEFPRTDQWVHPRRGGPRRRAGSGIRDSEIRQSLPGLPPSLRPPHHSAFRQHPARGRLTVQGPVRSGVTAVARTATGRRALPEYPAGT
ncbi:hypothetical protein ACFCYB_23085 [Streptomyces sp. NPDC056309]|uniref:hypothetical protein n=1 Tax=unclassified Streptomyces TaxID=2593676 RepID=UPI0035DA1BCE